MIEYRLALSFSMFLVLTKLVFPSAFDPLLLDGIERYRPLSRWSLLLQWQIWESDVAKE